MLVIERFNIDSHIQIPPPPHVVPMHGLYILISEKNGVIDKSLLDDMPACMTALIELENNEKFLSDVRNASLEWFLLPPHPVVRHIERTPDVITAHHEAMMSFGLEPSAENGLKRMHEMGRLRQYVEYMKDKAVHGALVQGQSLLGSKRRMCLALWMSMTRT